MGEDTSNKSKLSKLLRFQTTKSGENVVSLDNYIEGMPEWQKDIYYLAGQNKDVLLSSPFLERAQAKGVEVLLLSDPVDEYVMQNLPEYEGKKMVSVSKEGLK